MPRSRVLQLLATGGTGGAQESVIALLLHLDRSRFEVEAVSLADEIVLLPDGPRIGQATSPPPLLQPPARDFVRRYLTPQSDYAEWYFPQRLTLDVNAANLGTRGTPFEQEVRRRPSRLPDAGRQDRGLRPGEGHVGGWHPRDCGGRIPQCGMQGRGSAAAKLRTDPKLRRGDRCETMPALFDKPQTLWSSIARHLR